MDALLHGRRKGLLLISALLAGSVRVAAETAWFPVEDTVPVALLPPLSATLQTVNGREGLVATRTPEAYVTLDLAGVATDAVCAVSCPLTPARPIPDASFVRADIVNAGNATVTLGLAFRRKSGRTFRWNVRLPPGRRQVVLSPEDCVPAAPANRWADVTGLVLAVAAKTPGSRASLTIRSLTAVEAFRMRSRGGRPWPEERELLPADKRPLVFASRAGEFREQGSFFAHLPIDGKALFGGLSFPKSGGKLVLTVRATDPQTRAVEIGLHQSDGRIWGLPALAIRPDWQEIVVPLRRLMYFRHWGLPAIPPDAMPDAAKFTSAHVSFGKWLCGDSLDLPHGFEIKSIRITQ